MRNLIAPLVLGLATLGTPLPSASAAPIEHEWFDCGFDTVAHEVATGGQDTFTGVAYGYIASPTPGESVSIQCWISVDGSRVTETPTGTGTQVATAQGQVTYTASDTQAVDLCVDWSAGAESGSACHWFGGTFPPQEFFDLLNSVFEIVEDANAVLDPIVCGVIKDLDLPDQVDALYPITGIWIDPDDCDIWVVNLVGFECLTWFDFAPYHDPYNGPGPSC